MIGKIYGRIKGTKSFLLKPGLISPLLLLSSDCSKSDQSKDQLPPGSSMNMPQSFGAAMGFSLTDTLSVAALPGPGHNESHLRASEDSIVYVAPASDANRCWPIRPTLRNELDTFSVHFYVFFGPNISIPPDRAAVFAINLMPVLDSGGVLNMELKLNMVSRNHRILAVIKPENVSWREFFFLSLV